MLQPKRTKYTKQFKGRNRGVAKRAREINFGQYGLKATELGRLTSRQIEAARRVIARATKRTGKLWIRVFPDKPVTKKPVGVRQGKGKGSVEGYEALIQEGRILFEIGGVTEELAINAFTLASAKLPVKTRFIKKRVI